MKKYLLAPFLGALAMFVWGFFYYGVSGIPYQALQPAQDVGPALDKLFPESGAYIVPDPRMDPEAMEEKLEAGPFATVHIQKGGRPAMDPMILLQGFALEFVSCLLLVVLLSLAQIRWYTNRLLFASLVGLLIAIYAQGGLVIWWHQDLGWHARTIIHDVVAWFAAGAVIAGFAQPSN